VLYIFAEPEEISSTEYNLVFKDRSENGCIINGNAPNVYYYLNVIKNFFHNLGHGYSFTEQINVFTNHPITPPALGNVSKVGVN